MIRLVADLPVVQSAMPSAFQLVADIIIGMLGVITAVCGVIAAIFALRAHDRAKDTAGQIAVLRVEINGRMTQLLTATERAAYGSGVADERKNGNGHTEAAIEPA